MKKKRQQRRTCLSREARAIWPSTSILWWLCACYPRQTLDTIRRRATAAATAHYSPEVIKLWKFNLKKNQIKMAKYQERNVRQLVFDFIRTEKWLAKHTKLMHEMEQNQPQLCISSNTASNNSWFRELVKFRTNTHDLTISLKHVKQTRASAH